ncbi:cupin domain-containing protein [Fodinicola acaciae]|uniref:cupin domain-containing protein n=1 Tax=Fodinicola acaciae TaxID=2681555 RepID=UPI0013D79E09|nr:cupin domain-containing protein [Fodinicola acaciae]
MSVIENPATGERIVIRRTAADTGGSLLSWELFLAPGGHVPSGHTHPEQDERFVVLAGRMRFRLGRRTVVAGPGEVVRVPPGVAHSFSNPGSETAHVLVETRPALDMQDLLATAAWLSRRGRRLPAPLDLVLFMADFRREVRAPHFGALVNAVVVPAAWLARLCRLDRRYRRSAR